MPSTSIMRSAARMGIRAESLESLEDDVSRWSPLNPVLAACGVCARTARHKAGDARTADRRWRKPCAGPGVAPATD